MPQAVPAQPPPPAAPTVKGFTLGPWQTNCYVVTPNLASQPLSPSAAANPLKPCWIIDASFEPAPLIDHIRREGLTPLALILTHAHVDHIAGVSEVLAAFKNKSGPAGTAPLPVWNHTAEADWLHDPELNLSIFTGLPTTCPGPDRSFAEGDELELGDTRWRVLHVPGHSPGSIALACSTAPIVVSGDALFAGSIGRTDFPGCSFEQLQHSIREKLYRLDPATKVFPGHGPPTTIGRERSSNPFVSDS